MKTVLFLIPTLGGGGAERVLVNLVNNLDKEKYRITVQTLFDVGVNRQYLKKHIEYIPGFKKMFSGNVLLFKLFTPQALYKLLVKKRYDIVISYLEGPAARIVSGCPYDSKLISWVHVEQKTVSAAAYSYRSTQEYVKCCQKYDHTVCVAETVKQDFLSTVQLNKPCTVLYNTNEDQVIRDKGKEDAVLPVGRDGIKVISVARLRPEKGFDRLIEVHKRLLDEGFAHEIFVLGEGDEKEKLLKMIHSHRVQETFHLMGFHQNPYKYISKADLYVCPSFREGFSTAVTEALILGIPVVSTECSGAKELLGNDNEFGIVVENSIEGIYKGMKSMLSGVSTIRKYKLASEQRGQFFSKENTVLRVEQLLDNI